MKKLLNWIFSRNTNPALAKDYHKNVDPVALDIVKKIQKAGFHSYLVGGCVRDLLLNKSPKDFDIATAASPQKAKNLVPRSFIIGRRFRIVVAKRPLAPKELDQLGHPLFPLIVPRPIEKEFQITTFRRDPEMLDGKLNENVFGSPEQDALRRDFTVNGLFLDPIKNQIIDHVGGLDDIKAKRLRVIGNAEERFREDPIRILRALRIGHKCGLKPDSEVASAYVKTKDALLDAKRERIREELVKILREGSAEDIFKDFKRLGIFDVLCPRLAKSFHAHPKAETGLHHILKALDKTPWKNPQVPTPLFYLFLHPLFMALGSESHTKDEILEELKVFQAEQDGLQQISRFLTRLEKLSARGDFKPAFPRNPRAYSMQIESMYCLKILADADVGECVRLWKQVEPSWKEQSAHIRQTLKSSGSHHAAGPSRSSRSRRGSHAPKKSPSPAAT